VCVMMHQPFSALKVFGPIIQSAHLENNIPSVQSALMDGVFTSKCYLSPYLHIIAIISLCNTHCRMPIIN
jgi:hypothetical protein